MKRENIGVKSLKTLRLCFQTSSDSSALWKSSLWFPITIFDNPDNLDWILLRFLNFLVLDSI